LQSGLLGCIARLSYKSRGAFLRGAAATAVAISGSKILAVGSLDQVKAALGELPYRLDKTFADKVIDMANSALVRRAPTRWCGRPRRRNTTSRCRFIPTCRWVRRRR
jgi:hypothetical protein